VTTLLCAAAFLAAAAGDVRAGASGDKAGAPSRLPEPAAGLAAAAEASAAAALEAELSPEWNPRLLASARARADREIPSAADPVRAAGALRALAVSRAPQAAPPRAALADGIAAAAGTTGEEIVATFAVPAELPAVAPPAELLDAAFAKMLRKEARRAGADWALVVGVLRTQGRLDAAPASRLTVERLAARLAALGAGRDEERALVRLFGRTDVAERALVLSRVARAAGLDVLVTGLDEAGAGLARRVLEDPRIEIYASGRSDVAAGRIDARVLVLVLYLAETHGEVTVSSLVTGHRLYARPGVVSAHVAGNAVDLSAVAGVSVAGNQGYGSVTERVVRSILALPAELRPRQLISLLALGGPSFALDDHDDHVHVGY
jgi:hypothetical protein